YSLQGREPAFRDNETLPSSGAFCGTGSLLLSAAFCGNRRLPPSAAFCGTGLLPPSAAICGNGPLQPAPATRPVNLANWSISTSETAAYSIPSWRQKIRL